jgi:GT2 family glycosyltransferase
MPEPGDRPDDGVARVAAIVVTFNSGEVLDGCLRSLAAQTGVDLTTVVVADNASRDDSVAIAEAAQDVPVRVVELGRNAGYAAAINAAVATLELRKLDAVLVLNPDCRLRPDALRVLAAALRQPGRAFSAPKLLNPDGSLQPTLRRTPTVGRALAEAIIGGDRAGRIGNLGELIYDQRSHDTPGSVAWVTGAALLMSSAAMRELGPWDESFMLYSEETEYCQRATDRGWTVWYEPAAVVEHIGGESAVNPTLYTLMMVNKVVLFRRRRGAVAGSAYHGAVLLGEGIRAAAGRRVSRAAFPTLMRPSRREALIASLTGERP